MQKVVSARRRTLGVLMASAVAVFAIGNFAAPAFAACPGSAADCSKNAAASGFTPDDGSTTDTITVTIKDGSNVPQSGQTVSLTQFDGPGSPTISSPSGLSDVNGVVTFTVKSTTAGTVHFQAHDNGPLVFTVSQLATEVFTLGAPDVNHSTIGAVPTSVP